MTRIPLFFMLSSALTVSAVFATPSYAAQVEAPKVPTPTIKTTVPKPPQTGGAKDASSPNLQTRAPKIRGSVAGAGGGGGSGK